MTHLPPHLFFFYYSYVADAGTGAIIVYDVAQSKALRVVLPSSITSANDVLYMTLAYKKNEGYLYFTFLSSPRLYSIKTDLLRAGKGAGSIIDVGLKPYGKQLVLLGGDNGSSLFFRYKGENDIYTWNTETCFKAANLMESQRGGECRLSTQVSFVHRHIYMWKKCVNILRFPFSFRLYQVIEDLCGHWRAISMIISQRQLVAMVLQLSSILLLESVITNWFGKDSL